MTHRRIVISCIGLLFAATALFLLIRPDRAGIERVEYRTYKGDNPTGVEMTFSRPSSDLATVPQTQISNEFTPGELLSIQGELKTEPQEVLLPVVVNFVLHTREGDVVGMSAVIGPPYDPKNIDIKMNCTRDPGKYTLLVEWGGGHNYIAQATVTVRPK